MPCHPKLVVNLSEIVRLAYDMVQVLLLISKTYLFFKKTIFLKLVFRTQQEKLNQSILTKIP